MEIAILRLSLPSCILTKDALESCAGFLFLGQMRSEGNVARPDAIANTIIDSTRFILTIDDFTPL